MSQTYFFLGNTPNLSVLELNSLYNHSFSLISENIASSSEDFSYDSYSKLAGTRKIAQKIAISQEKDLESTLIELIIADNLGKNFAITNYANLSSTVINFKNIKQKVTDYHPIRFVSMDTNEHELLMLSSQHVNEYNLIPDNGCISITKTIWISPSKEWIHRDRKKPYRNISRGMLPPKIARIMVNLSTRGDKNLVLCDPFCGTGTILAEALLNGNKVVGSDSSREATTGAAKNLAWLTQNYSLNNSKYDLFAQDATHISYPFDVIATEPYMGPLIEEKFLPPLKKIQDLAKGLKKLYIGSLKNWHKHLKNQGMVVISIPSYSVYGKNINTLTVDTFKSLGYNHVATAPYGKPGAVVVRSITILEKI